MDLKKAGLVTLVGASLLAGCDKIEYRNGIVLKEQQGKGGEYALQVTSIGENFTIDVEGPNSARNAFDLAISPGTRIQFEYKRNGHPLFREDRIGSLHYSQITVVHEPIPLIEQK